MLHNLSCCETRFRLLCCWYLLDSSLNLVFRQHELITYLFSEWRIKNEIKCFDFGGIKRELRTQLRTIMAIEISIYRFASPYGKTWRFYQNKLLHLQNAQTIYKIILCEVVMQRIWTMSVQRAICTATCILIFKVTPWFASNATRKLNSKPKSSETGLAFVCHLSKAISVKTCHST